MQGSQRRNREEQQQQQQQKEERNDDFTTPAYTRLLTHFKNSIYEGFFKTNLSHREGPGLTIMDNMACILGNYRNDQLSGQTLIFLTPNTYAIAQFNKGLLDGPFVIRSPTITIYSDIKSNKIDGEIVIIDYTSLEAQLWAIEADGIGQLHNQLDISDIVLTLEERAQRRDLENKKVDRVKNIGLEDKILKGLAPYVERAPGIGEFIKNFKFYGGKKEMDLMPGFTHRVFKNNQLLYLADAKGVSDNFVGLALNKKQEIIAAGCFSRRQKTQNQPHKLTCYENLFYLSGLGYLISCHENYQTLMAGQFFQDKLNGQGYKEIIGQKSIFGKFNKGDLREMDIVKISEENQQTKKMYLKRVKSIHIHSLQFSNNYSNERPVFILQNLINKIDSGRQENQ